MGLFLALCGAAALWVFLWSIGVKAIDGFMLFLLIVLVAAAVRIITPHLPGNRPGDY